MNRRRLAGLGAAVLLVGIAILAGEYSTLDWLTLRGQLALERDSVRALRAELDSLARVVRAIETDAATLERVAREEIGMIRNGEILYRIVPERERR
ncbi:MAG: FtsB family cell division protein [Gemmatimonadales bacterium]